MKKIKSIFLSVLMLMTMIIALCSCGSEKLDGKYISAMDSNVYLELTSDSKAVYHNGDNESSGSYRVVNDVVMVMLPDVQGDDSTMLFELDSEDTLYLNGLAAFEKESFWAKIWSFIKEHWLIILIVFVVLGIAGTIIEKIEDKE